MIYNILVDGESLLRFNPERHEHVHFIPLGFQGIPTVSVEYDSNLIEVTIVQATALPGYATITAVSEVRTDVYTIEFPESAALLNHPMYTQSDFNAVIDGYSVRVDQFAYRKNASFNAFHNAMWFEAEGLWTSSGFKYDITHLVAGFPAGTQFTLSMEVMPTWVSDVVLGFLYDGNEGPTGQGETVFPNVSSADFNLLEAQIELRDFSSSVHFYAFNGLPAMFVRNIMLTAAVEDGMDIADMATHAAATPDPIPDDGDGVAGNYAPGDIPAPDDPAEWGAMIVHVEYAELPPIAQPEPESGVNTGIIVAVVLGAGVAIGVAVFMKKKPGK